MKFNDYLVEDEQLSFSQTIVLVEGIGRILARMPSKKEKMESVESVNDLGQMIGVKVSTSKKLWDFIGELPPLSFRLFNSCVDYLRVPESDPGQRREVIVQARNTIAKMDKSDVAKLIILSEKGTVISKHIKEVLRIFLSINPDSYTDWYKGLQGVIKDLKKTKGKMIKMGDLDAQVTNLVYIMNDLEEML